MMSYSLFSVDYAPYTSFRDINERTEARYIRFRGEITSLCNVSRLANLIDEKRVQPNKGNPNNNLGGTFSVEQGVIKYLAKRMDIPVMMGKKTKRGPLYGTPDVMMRGIPGEIKTTRQEVDKPKEKWLIQAGLYAYLYQKEEAFLIVAKFSFGNEGYASIGVKNKETREALIENIYVYTVRLHTPLSEKGIEELCNPMSR